MTNILEYYVPESEGALRALQGSLPRYTKLGLRKKMIEIKRRKVEEVHQVRVRAAATAEVAAAVEQVGKRERKAI